MKSPFMHLILSFIAGAIVLAGYGVWYATIAAKSVAVTALQSRIDEKTRTINKIATTRAALAEIVDDEAVVQGYFVPETGVVSFIDGLEARGRAQGTAVSVLSVSSDKTSARPVITFTLAVKGTFDAVMRTVGSIEYAPYDISIAALSIGKKESKSGWHADLKLLVGSSAVSTTTKAL